MIFFISKQIESKKVKFSNLMLSLFEILFEIFFFKHFVVYIYILFMVNFT
jgi:hypothetical protein